MESSGEFQWELHSLVDNTQHGSQQRMIKKVKFFAEILQQSFGESERTRKAEEMTQELKDDKARLMQRTREAEEERDRERQRVQELVEGRKRVQVEAQALVSELHKRLEDIL